MNPKKPRVVLAWSSGKDSSWALHTLRQQNEVDVVGLLTTFNQKFERVAMHSVRKILVEQQAQEVGLPLYTADIPWPCTNENYEQVMQSTLEQLIEKTALTHVAFGDLYLQDIRSYRERNMDKVGLGTLFPLWGQDTTALSEEMIGQGLRAVVTCVDPKVMDASFAGRVFDAEFVESLPDGVDPCGENGEFHTFAFQGPMFANPVSISHGEVVNRDGFVFADIYPDE